MKSSVIIFPGSNCDRDMDVALKKFGFENQMVWHNDVEIPKSDLIVLQGVSPMVITFDVGALLVNQELLNL